MKVIDNSTVGGRIRECRKKLNWSQDNLALDMGTSKALISQYERGKSKAPIDKLEKLAEILHTTPEYLQYGIMPDNDDKRMNRLNMLINSLDDESDKDYVFFLVESTVQWILEKKLNKV